jgi:hypothetical protein
MFAYRLYAVNTKKNTGFDGLVDMAICRVQCSVPENSSGKAIINIAGIRNRT